IVARVAFTIAEGDGSIHVDVGPIDTRASVTTMLLVAFTFAFLRIAVQLIQNEIGARVGAGVLKTMRRDLIRSYLRADWPLQSSQREGAIQDLLMTYTGASAGAVNRLTGLMATAFNLAALLVTAIAVNAIAAVAAGLTALAIGM